MTYSRSHFGCSVSWEEHICSSQLQKATPLKFVLNPVSTHLWALRPENPCWQGSHGKKGCPTLPALSQWRELLEMPFIG